MSRNILRGMDMLRRREDVLTQWRSRRGHSDIYALLEELVRSRVRECFGEEAVGKMDAASSVKEESSPQMAETGSRPSVAGSSRSEPLSLPAEKDLNRILKYEASIHRQLAYSMNQARKGCNAPAKAHTYPRR